MTLFFLLLLVLESLLWKLIVNLFLISLFRNSYFFFHKVFSVFQIFLFLSSKKHLPVGVFGPNLDFDSVPINLMSYCIVQHHYYGQWQTKENRTSSYNEKHLPVRVFWSHCWLSMSNLGDFVLIWWEYVWFITRHDSRPFYIFQIWKNTCSTWFREKHQPVSVFHGYCTKYKCIIFIDLWFYLNDCVFSQLLLVMSLSGQKIGPGLCLTKKCPLLIGLSCRFHGKTMENCQNLSFHSLDTKFLPWVINSSLFLDKKSIQIISYTYCGSLHKLWNFLVKFYEIWTKIFKIIIAFLGKYESIWVKW